jgi:hypothetical protein
VRFDRANGDDEVGQGDAQVHESRGALARLAEEGIGLCEPLSVEHANASPDVLSYERGFLVCRGRAVDSAGDEDLHVAQGDPRCAQLRKYRWEEARRRAGPAGVWHGDNHAPRSTSEFSQRWRIDRCAQRVM